MANYPPALDSNPAITLSTQQYWYQKLDGQPFFAYIGPGTIGTKENAIRLLSRYVTDPLTPGILATEGVRYVVLHDDVYRAQKQSVPSLSPRYFRLLKTFPNVRIFSVHAPHVDLHALVESHVVELSQVEGLTPPGIDYGTGFNQPEQYQGSTRRWMINDGELKVENGHSVVTHVTLEGLAFSNSTPHTLEVTTSDGKVLASQAIPTSEVGLHLGPFKIPAGHFTLKLVATPDAVRLGGTDKRLGTVFLSPLVLFPIPDYLVNGN